MSQENETWNPYHKLLGIPADRLPPDYYTLLGLVAFEKDPEVIPTLPTGA